MKQIKDLRWRAKRFGKYYYVGTLLDVCESIEDETVTDDRRHASCNYFRTPEATEEAAKMARELFKNLKTE